MRYINIRTVLVIAIASSVLSQIQEWSFFLRPIMFAMWIIVLFLSSIKNGMYLEFPQETKFYFYLYIIYTLFCSICGIFNDAYFSGRYISIMLIPLFISIVADNSFLYIDENDISFLIKIYVVSACIYAITVQFVYFSSYSTWLSSNYYLFGSKNSAAQIWGTAILASVIYIKEDKKIKQLLWYIIAIYLIVIMGMSQARTAMIGLALSVFIYLIVRQQHKLQWIIFVIVLGFILYNIPAVRTFIEQAFLLTKYAGADIDTVSGGRITLYKEAINVFIDSPIIGCGSYKVDCSYINVLAESGIIGFIIIESIWFRKVVGLFHNTKIYQDKLPNCSKLLFCLTIFYLFESFLEGCPPFGPGVSSFFFWFLSSLYTNNINKGVDCI